MAQLRKINASTGPNKISVGQLVDNKTQQHTQGKINALLDKGTRLNFYKASK